VSPGFGASKPPGAGPEILLGKHIVSIESSGETQMAEPPGAGQPGQPQADLRWLREAIELSRNCPPSTAAFSVGAILVSDAGEVIATGYSRERDPADHAEEVALDRAAGDPRLAAATLYSSLEPCLARGSRPHPCAELIVAAGVGRVVIAWLEPPLFVEGGGAAALREAGVTVVEIPWLADLARSVNAHLVPKES
jgi:diaminohydroxyphosphoribosylaminopyrimidine deaminase/5-amino-6-(5-phosphoribosylamino)uracil reductase